MTEGKVTDRTKWLLVQGTALLAGGAFVVLGVLGFIPGITTNYDELRFAGSGSAAQLFGVFTVSVLHNLVHLLSGVAGLFASRYAGGSRAFLTVGGLAYLVMWVYGIGTDKAGAANFVPFDHPGNWLHLCLGLGMIVLGIAMAGLDRRRDGPAGSRV